MSDQDAQITVIGADTHIKGELSFERTAQIFGRLEGKVTSAGELQIGASAHCTAAVEVGTVIVDGQVDGDILARERVQLNGTARVNGDVVAEKLIVAEGASFSGHCQVGPEAVANAPAPKPRTIEPVAAPKAPAMPDRTAEIKPVPQPTEQPTDQTNGKPGGPKLDWIGEPVIKDAQAKTGWGPTPTTTPTKIAPEG